MEKLIELLNEFEKHISLGGLADWREFDGNLHYYSNNKDEYVFDNVYYRIISKNYGFIKWLVENDKIDIKKVKEGEIMLSRNDEENTIGKLSISDTPIDLLCSLLK